MTRWAQIELLIWEQLGKDKAVVALFGQTSQEEPFTSLTFEYPDDDEEGLGFAIVRFSSGIVGALVDDAESSISGTYLFRPGSVEQSVILHECCDAFGLHEVDIKWMSGQPMDIS